MKADKRTNNGLQKGQRRQRLHEDQNNVGNENEPSFFENHNGDQLK